MKDLRILDVRQTGNEIEVTVYGGKDNVFGTYSFYSLYDEKRREFQSAMQLWADSEVDVTVGRSEHGRTFIKNSVTGVLMGYDLPCTPHTSRSEQKNDEGQPKDWGLQPPFPKFYDQGWEE